MRGLQLLVVLSLVAWPFAARSQSKQECAEGYESAQAVRSAGKLLEAQRQLRFCAQQSCPEIVTQDCARWLAEVDAALPNVLFPFEARGEPSAKAVRVLLDGSEVVSALDGRAVTVDPGRHRVSFVGEDSKSVDVDFVVVEGEKGRRIVGRRLPDSGTPSKPGNKATRGLSPVFWIVAGSSVALLGVASALTVSGRSSAADLRRECAPRCEPSRVDELQQRLLLADVSSGVGLGAAGLAAYLFFSELGRTSGPAVGASAVPGRAFATVRGSF